MHHKYSIIVVCDRIRSIVSLVINFKAMWPTESYPVISLHLFVDAAVQVTTALNDLGCSGASGRGLSAARLQPHCQRQAYPF